MVVFDYKDLENWEKMLVLNALHQDDLRNKIFVVVNRSFYGDILAESFFFIEDAVAADGKKGAWDSEQYCIDCQSDGKCASYQLYQWKKEGYINQEGELATRFVKKVYHEGTYKLNCTQGNCIGLCGEN